MTKPCCNQNLPVTLIPTGHISCYRVVHCFILQTLRIAQDKMGPAAWRLKGGPYSGGSGQAAEREPAAPEPDLP